MSRTESFLRTIFQRPERFFVASGGLFGIVFILLVPPFQTPDEPTHFLRAYEISQFGIVSQEKKGIVGDDLPKSLSKLQPSVDTPALEFQGNVKYNLHKTAAALHQDLNDSDRQFTSVGGGVTYSPVGYIPQAIGILIGRMFGFPPIVLLYMARVATLITWLVLIFISIKLIPYKKWTVAGLALLPMLVAQAGAVGVDIVSVGLGILFIALVLKLRKVNKVSWKQWAILLAIASAISLTKQTTLLVLGFVFFLLPQWYKADRRIAIFRVATILVIPVILFMIWTVISFHLGSYLPHVTGQNSGGQLHNIIEHPFRLAQVIFNTFFFTWGDSVVTSFIGDFGWMDTPLSGGIVAIGYITLFVILFGSYETVAKKFTKWQLVWTALLIALYAIGTCAALYIIYSPVNFDIVYGLQGRYFLLALFIALPLIVKIRKNTSVASYSKFVMIGTTTLLVASILTIYFRYYIRLF